MHATAKDRERLRALRRELHRRPEPGWCEFYTTDRILAELESIGVDDLHVGREALAPEARLGVPGEGTLAEWLERAREAGARESTLDRLAGGYTGAIAELHRGPGPTVALRVDIDGLVREESTDPDHEPAAAGFRSEHEGVMHACGHDAHAAIGVGVFRALAREEFEGTFKLICQPAEERVGGGRPVAESGHLDDVDVLLAVHVGLGHPTGEVVAGIDGFLAVRQFEARFAGKSAHAGGHPERGDNAVQAMATAIGELYAIPRHGDGPTRVNAGRVEGGTASNVIPESASIEGEVRGGRTDLMEYTFERARRVLRSAARMHGCEVSVETRGEAPSARSDESVVERVGAAAERVEGVESVRERGELGGSEDATYLMERVKQHGGEAGYVCVGTDHPGEHHSGTFDVDERSLGIGVDVLTETALSVFDAPD